MSRSSLAMLVDMSVVVVIGVGMNFIPSPRMFLASVVTNCCDVRSWRVELRGCVLCVRSSVCRRVLMAFRIGEMEGLMVR